MAQLLITGARVATGFIASTAQRQIANLFAPDVEGPRQADLQIQTSTEGASIPRVYGRMRLSGQLIWAARFNETSVTRSSGGGKGGGPTVTDYSYSVSLAVGLCEGEIGGIGRVWADGTLLSLQDVTWRVHKGSADQMPDPVIEAIEGSGAAPAYRGLAYVVFEDLPLEAFGNRIPNLSFEVIAPTVRDAAAMEARINGVCMIPSSGEFAYADRAVMREIGEGEDKAENHHSTRASCDFEASLDDLEARLPQCGSVALVTAWFGDDLRADTCTLTPRVESFDKQTHPLEWSAAGLSRQQAQLVSQSNGSPVFGGTPSDETLIQAIRAMQARGLEVTLYPFILMDIPSGNGLPDPYGGTEQATFPWRGRVTCHPAPGQPGSPDKTVAATALIDAFFGSAQASDFVVSGDTVVYSGPEEWSFNRFILHHAAIAKAAGGVESFIIGSEMRALTQVRDGLASYPAVARLVSLAAEVRSLLGPGVKLSYAADWSEYFGHSPADGSGDRLFHLDRLWASADIDFIGIDWYAPLSDWREGTAHLDALAGTGSIHDRDYLKSNVEGGEGYDWYYASSADRDAQLRTPITDGAYAEPWVYRYKDLRSWWSEPHHDRIAGVRQTSPTGWVPQSKPVRLVELGCPAVDKGANQPNVFIDPKSSESTPPYYSTGARDDLIQRRYIEALLAYWQGAANPISSVYSGAMLDLAHSHVWTWDARPFPEFPTRDDVWSDGSNWRLGHWLTGRAGQSSVGEIVGDIASQAGLDDLDTTKLAGVLAGYVINAGARARDEIERLGAIFGFDVVDRANGPVCVPHLKDSAPVMVAAQSLTVRDDGPGLSFGQEAEDAQPTEVRLQFAVDDGDYRPASVSALGLDHETQGVIEMALNCLADRDLATRWARGALSRMQAETRTAALTLPPSLVALEAGDCIMLDAGPHGAVWCLASAEGTEARDCELVGTRGGLNVTTGPQPEGGAAPRPPSRPALTLLDLPLRAGEPARNGFLAAGWSDPWPGKLTVYAGPNADALTSRAEITAPAFTGQLEADLGPGHEGRWDRANAIKVRLSNGAVSSATATRVLNGANLIAVATAQAWEVLSFTNAQLEPDGSWTLTGLLRGLGGTAVSGAGAGAKVVLLDEACVTLPVHDHEVGTDLTVVAVPPGKPINDVSARTVSARYDGAEHRPLAPVHVVATLSGTDLQVSWIRRARVAADAWAYGDVALDEAREAYQVVWLEGEVEVSRSEVDAPAITLTAAQQATLFPSGLSAATVEIAQLSDRFGPGAVARCDLSALS